MKIILDDKKSSVKLKYLNNDHFNEINKLLRSMRKYCMRAYKQLIFDFNKLTPINKREYRLDLITDKIFELVYGPIFLIVEFEQEEIVINRVEPYDFFKNGHAIELQTYKGIPVANKKAREKIKILEGLGKI